MVDNVYSYAFSSTYSLDISICTRRCSTYAGAYDCVVHVFTTVHLCFCLCCGQPKAVADPDLELRWVGFCLACPAGILPSVISSFLPKIRRGPGIHAPPPPPPRSTAVGSGVEVKAKNQDTFYLSKKHSDYHILTGNTGTQ